MVRKVGLITILLFVICFLYLNNSFVCAKENDIRILIKTNKKVIRPGDDMTIYLCLTNNSNKSYAFSSWKLKDILLIPSFFNSKGKQLLKRRRFKLQFGLGPMIRFTPFKEELFYLKPFQKRLFKYRFVLKRGVKCVTSGKLFYGDFLENKNGDYIIVSPNRKIIIQFKYRPDVNEISTGKYYGFKNMYDKLVVSNKVVVQIK